MSKEEKDLFGNRMKQYEERYTSTKLPSYQPIVARIDGKGFSKFTKGFEKPFDVKLADAFIETTKSIMAATNATCGYAQSDEITLVYDGNENPASEHYFGGKVSKLNSVFASMATAFFNKEISSEVDTPAFFDCRVFSVPDRIEASNAVLWRVQDARKNSISAFTRYTIGHAKMQNLSGLEMIRLVEEETGKSWHDIETKYRYGVLLKGRPIAKRVHFDTYFGDLTLEERVEFVTKHEREV